MNFLLLGLGAALCSLLLAKVILKKAVEIELIDRPNERSSHSQDIPKGGGLVFAGLFTLFNLYFYFFVPSYKSPVTALLIAGPALFGLGWIDDRLRLSASLRLGIHLLISFLVLFSLTRGFSSFFTVLFVSDGVLFTVLFLLLYLTWFVNLYNFMDGADGIAGGVGLMGALALSLLSYLQGVEVMASLYFVLACCLVGFLWFNWSPAQFFMGDSGAYFLGVNFATLSLVGKAYYGLSMYPTVIIFGLFILDATYTLIQRVQRGHKPFEPHQQFGFHKLFKKGWSHQKAALFYVGIVTFWLVPMAALTQVLPAWQFTILFISYLPLLGFEVYIKAGKG